MKAIYQLVVRHSLFSSRMLETAKLDDLAKIALILRGQNSSETRIWSEQELHVLPISCLVSSITANT
jgi:hypothetical protein